MSCDATLPAFSREDGDIEVSDKYIKLMQDSMCEESLYMRAKDTFKVIFADLQITEKEKAQIVAEHVASMTTNLSSTAMQVALQWAKEERDGGYTLAKLKADAETSQAQTLKTIEEICLVEKQTELACANITATISGTFRENGEPTGYDATGCKPTGLKDEGLKYHQTLQVEAATYKEYADAFRKSGVVDIGVGTDNVLKGITGGVDPITGGYTNQSTLNAERQRVGFEDSKVSHAANASAAMIASMLSSEIPVNCKDVQRWRDAVDRLLSKSENMGDISDTPYSPPACETTS